MRRVRDKRTVDVELGHGDALIMRGATQRYWKYGVPERMNVHGVRYNATLRSMVEEEDA